MTRQYIITDPCYIIDSDVWSDICEQCIGPDSNLNDEKFNELASAELNRLAETTNAIACRTGFGDWDNCMHCSNDDKIIQSDFFADSGMVCVVEYTNDIKDRIDTTLIERGGIALIETEGEVKIEMDTNDPDWTVVYIEDDVDSFSSCLPYNEEEDND